MREKRNEYEILVGNRMGRDHLGDLSINDKIILKWILEKGCKH
jgi:hypothetical protein